MLPTLQPADLLLVRYGGGVRPGSVVLARFPDGTLAVKRVRAAVETATGGAGWYLLSDNPDEGVDSRHRGPMRQDAVLGVVRSRLWPRPRWFS